VSTERRPLDLEGLSEIADVHPHIPLGPIEVGRLRSQLPAILAALERAAELRDEAAIAWQERAERVEAAARRLRDAQDAYEKAINQPGSSWREAGNTLAMTWQDFRAALAPAPAEEGSDVE
jgi:transposase